MNLHPNRFVRGLLLITLLLSFLGGWSFLTRAHAAPQEQTAMNLVISEFRTTGPSGGNDEFIEIYNPTNSSIPLSGLTLQKSAGCSTTVTDIGAALAGSLASGQYILVGGTNYSGSVLPDFSNVSIGVADDGGIALVNTSTIPPILLDQVGMCDSTQYKEGTALVPLRGTSDQSYERIGGGCIDANDNFQDFLRTSPSSPHNSNSFLPCLRVIDVSSTTLDGTYTINADINIVVQFSSNVNVTGTPTLLLETGMNDGLANYVSGSGTSSLTFVYTVKSGDASADLDYVSSSSLSGTIIGAVGNADLTLPAPGASHSLSFNNAIVLDNQANPHISSFTRQNPTSPITNADVLVFRATFSEPVVGVDSADFIVNGVTGADITVTPVNGIVYDVQISNGNLPTLNNTVTLALSASPTIADTVGYPLTVASPNPNDAYQVDNLSPNVTVDQANNQDDPASTLPIRFTAVFSEAIDTSTFTPAAISQSGTAINVSWIITDTGDHKTFTLSVVGVGGNGTLIPSIGVDRVKDLAGNSNTASTFLTDNSVTFGDTIAPTVTVNRSNSQPPFTNTLPIQFSVVFSEPINASTFEPVDITQSGTATVATWQIVDKGDHTNFTLLATVVGENGTLIPSIMANSVLDYAFNNNLASTSTDNVVTYDKTSPTVTVNQAAGQPDPALALPIRFTVVFSEPINVSTLALTDFTQSGTARGVVWSLKDSGDHKTFTLSATSLTANGTLKPSLAAAEVTDLAGNNNKASTSTDNTVTTNISFPTPTRTSTPAVTKTRTPTRTPTRTGAPPTATPTLGVVINEVAWMGTLAKTSDEWVELYNRGSATVNMNGWQLILRSTPGGTVTDTITIAGTLASGDYYILAPASAFTDVVIDQNISTNFNNSGEVLELRDANGKLIDTANSDGGLWPAGTASPGYSTMERHAGNTLDTAANWYTYAGTPTPSDPHDRDNNLVRGTPGKANWAASVTATPTKSPTPTRTATRRPGLATATASATVVINEFLPRAGFDWNQDGKVNVYDEFIEIANLGPLNINLTGWKLDDEAGRGSNPYTLPNITLTPGQHLVVYASQSNVLLSDGGDTVRLLNPNNVIKDAQTYSVVKVEDQSWCRLPDINGSWFPDCFPTPNQRNTREGMVPNAPPGTGLEEQRCTLPDTLPEDFRSAECFGFGGNMWQPMYWDVTGWLKDFLVPQNESKWETYIE
jgi:hypothetical protein